MNARQVIAVVCLGAVMLCRLLVDSHWLALSKGCLMSWSPTLLLHNLVKSLQAVESQKKFNFHEALTLSLEFMVTACGNMSDKRTGLLSSCVIKLYRNLAFLVEPALCKLFDVSHALFSPLGCTRLCSVRHANQYVCLPSTANSRSLF